MNKLISSILFFSLAVSSHSYDINNDGRIDRSEYHWANPTHDLYTEFGKLDFNNDGFIDAAEQERQLRIQDMTESVARNLEFLENLSRADLTHHQAEQIFGVESSRGSKCSLFEGLGCTAGLSGAILACVPTVLATGGVALPVCVATTIGAGAGCVPCICWVAKKVAPGVPCNV